MFDQNYEFDAKIWLWVTQSGKGAWHFVTLPEDISDEISFFMKQKIRAFGSLRVSVKIGETQWQTSLFKDKKKNAFLLPIKADIRKKEKIGVNDIVIVEICASPD